jgi:hypothetical protein
MDWQLLCAFCPQVAGSFRELDKVHCNAINDVALDDYIQVSFTVAGSTASIGPSAIANFQTSVSESCCGAKAVGAAHGAGSWRGGSTTKRPGTLRRSNPAFNAPGLRASAWR